MLSLVVVVVVSLVPKSIKSPLEAVVFEELEELLVLVDEELLVLVFAAAVLEEVVMLEEERGALFEVPKPDVLKGALFSLKD